ncbi:MAG: hypothetical protein Q8L13_11855 [Bradyrhizobium sp.]|uniref:hypothetical protein n=1 Tax=Bradyrhizobium sp. TaxID=376 RepID=UPI00273079ED|nr:hypothetical protein [Bradyrhizobium sp.]MDP1867020.1 hypothetical protein [Bradyrhizobium sp.]
MTSVYNFMRDACGLSQLEAAENVHGARLDTIKSWSTDRRPAPDWAINQLQSLIRQIRRAGENYASMLKKQSRGNVFILGLAHDEQDARACGFPSLASQRQALAIAISLLPDDAEIRIVPRVQGSIPAPVMQRETTIPTATDVQVLASMAFTDGKFYTAGNMNRRKYERLEDIGWVKGIATNISDVEYYLTAGGSIQMALAETAETALREMPDPAPGGFQTSVSSGPRRRPPAKLKINQETKVGDMSFRIRAINGPVVTAELSSGEFVDFHVPSILLETSAGTRV